MTANQVTIARIALLPIPCALLLFGTEAMHWAGFFLFVFLGMTDFVDGMMARREGPTKLGGLLDPVADKIMMAAITLSLSGMGWIPNWVTIAILSREFLLIVLRSSVAMREQSVKTSTLAKIKTIVQMGGFGTVFMTLFLSTKVASVVALCWVAFFVAIGAYWKLIRRDSAPYWAWPVAASFLYWFILLTLFSTKTVVLCLCLVIVGITWLSAFDYLKTSYAVFAASGLGRQDLVRLFWALAYSVPVVCTASDRPSLIIPVLISIAFELGLGGIDNIAIAEGKVFQPKFFLIPALIACWFSLVRSQFLAIILVLVSARYCWLAAREVTWRFFPAR